jgi:DNA-binding transcriptional LysR family regulator
MIPDLPSPLLRNFAAVVDCGSLAGAAMLVGRSESALSLQMSRLEDVVGQPLFDRDGRALKLNRAGGVLLGHARAILGRIDAARAELGPAFLPPVKVGVVQDFVSRVLRPTLTDLRAANPATGFEIVIGSTAELLQALGEDRIDTALCVADVLAAETAIRFPMQWFGSAGLLQGDVIPLVSITPPCPFLKAAQRALDAMGRPWRIALVTPSLDGLRAAVEAGLGIACRTQAGIDLPPLRDTALPDLPSAPYGVIERRPAKGGQGPVAARLAMYLSALAPTGH